MTKLISLIRFGGAKACTNSPVGVSFEEIDPSLRYD